MWSVTKEWCQRRLVYPELQPSIYMLDSMLQRKLKSELMAYFMTLKCLKSMLMHDLALRLTDTSRFALYFSFNNNSQCPKNVA